LIPPEFGISFNCLRACQPNEGKYVDVDAIQAGEKLEGIQFGNLYPLIGVHFEVSVAPLGAVEALTVRGRLLWDDEINGIVFERCFSGRPDQRVDCLYWWLHNAWNVVLLRDMQRASPLKILLS
jgi:hypothetical protein